MDINTITCAYCGGTGRVTIWKEVSKDTETNTCTLQSEEVTCEKCNGTGWIDYPVFSVEEAKAILKHCGLSTED